MVAKSQPTDASDREPLSGLVERVTFHSSETGFCVLRVKVRGHRDLVTVLGSAADIHSGEYVQASGRWERHRDHGMQFRALFLQVTSNSPRHFWPTHVATATPAGRKLRVATGQTYSP